MELLIKPVDVWLFRDGRPFFAGDDHEAATIFPPTPFTLQGAIRTKVLVEKGVDLHEFMEHVRQEKPHPIAPEIGYGDNFGNFRLIGPILARKRDDGEWERLIPMPADVVKVGDEFVLLKPQPLPFKTNLPEKLQLLWVQLEGEPTGEPKQVKEAKGWLPESEWQRYLQGEPPNQVVSDGELFAFEPRFGIAIERSKRTTKTQMLYKAKFVRLKDDVALWAKVEGVKLPEHGFLRFGGEGRGASYEAVKPLPSLASHFPKLDKRFKIVLLSPAWFSGGWQPAGGDWSKIFGFPVRLVASAISRPQKFGGFDVAKGEPKPIRNFVPAGSVYFFEANEPVQLPEGFAFTETPEEVEQANGNKNAWAQIGFGNVLVGSW